MSRKKIALWIALAVLAFAALLSLAAWQLWPSAGPLDAVPEKTLALVEVDVRALRKSKLKDKLEQLLNERAPVDKLDHACGFATLERVERGAVTIGEGEEGGVGLAIAGVLAEAELFRCETQILLAVGETQTKLAAPTRQGGFLLTPLRAGGVDLQVGYGLRRPLLVATPSWAQAMVEAVEARDALDRWFSRAPKLPAAHDEVLRALEASAAGTLLLAWASSKRPAAWTAPLGSLPARLSPPLRQRAEQVKGWSNVGLGLTLNREGERATVHLVMHTEDEASAEALSEVLLGARLAYAQNLLLRATGMGPLLDSLKVNTKGPWVTATMEEDALQLVEHLSKIPALIEELPR